QRTALINELRAALREYYPVALQAFEDWTMRSSWAFVERFPTPAALVQAGRERSTNYVLKFAPAICDDAAGGAACRSVRGIGGGCWASGDGVA
ncbi:MAG TPA: hypothetical protein PKK06_18215, partial [Phycisphaerae bacterium]|nr:hypothetical protein [Phycisphaerae bacterium]